jgi:hypothetical protein
MTDEERLKRIKDYNENVRKCHPCDYCSNPKHLTSLCTEYACYGYSRFKPKPNTPSYVLDKVEDMQDSLIW